MKKNGLFKSVFACWILLFCSFAVSGQNLCEDPNCIYSGILNISTGIDNSTNTVLTPLALEQNWKLVATPTNVSLGPNAPSYVITPAGGWGTLTGAQWISAYTTASNGTNNWPPATYGAYEFELCFCICDSGYFNIQFDFLCDDYATIHLDGGAAIATSTSYQYVYRTIYNQNHILSAGTHCLKVKLYNTGGSVMGFDLSGGIMGAGLLRKTCCKPNGKICGFKLLDNDCDSSVDALNDQHLAGWTIILKDAFGTPIASTTTDAQGNYCFENLAPGNYQVSEALLTGWLQSYPPSPGIHNVTLPASGAVLANFGNCNTVYNASPCDSTLKFNYTVNNCQVNFNTVPFLMSPLYSIASTEWDFGDGYSSDELNPIHFYASAGSYMVCLTQTFFNGQTCCTLKTCQVILVNTPCDKGCTIRASITDTIDSLTCNYTFMANIVTSGLPISSIYWNFGDGSHAFGSTVTHQFPGPGTYNVCLHLFAVVKDKNGNETGCCFSKICTTIVVTCDPCAGASDPTGQRKALLPAKEKLINPTDQIDSDRLSDTRVNVSEGSQNIIVLNQNVPNPFAESTVITYNIPSKFRKAQIVFTTSNGKTIKTFTINEPGEGRLSVFANDLSTGVYSYTLVVDGRIIDSKNMIKN